MITFTVNTVGVLVWILMVSVLVPVISVVFLLVLSASIHIFLYFNVKIEDTYNKAKDKLAGKDKNIIEEDELDDVW